MGLVVGAHGLSEARRCLFVSKSTIAKEVDA